MNHYPWKRFLKVALRWGIPNKDRERIRKWLEGDQVKSMKEKPTPETPPRMDQLAEIRRMFDCAAEISAVAEMLHDQAVMRLSGVIRSIKADYEALTSRVKKLKHDGKP